MASEGTQEANQSTSEQFEDPSASTQQTNSQQSSEQQSDGQDSGEQQAQGEQAKEEVQDDNTPVLKEDPRTSVQKNEEYRFAANIPGDQTIPEKAYADYTLHYDEDDATSGKIPDVLLDVPVVKVDEINFELNDLRAKVSLFAKVLDLVELSVGVDAYLGRVKLVITGVEAQALLKVRLDNVTAIIDRVLTTIDRNPQIIEKLVEGVSSAVEDVGAGAGSAVEDVGEGAGELVGGGLNSAVEDVGAGAGDLVGEGANQAVADVGSGAGSAVEDVGEGAGSAVEDVGEGAGEAVESTGEAVEDVGEGAGEAVESTGEAVEDVGEGAGEATQQLGEGAGQAAPVKRLKRLARELERPPKAPEKLPSR